MKSTPGDSAAQPPAILDAPRRHANRAGDDIHPSDMWGALFFAIALGVTALGLWLSGRDAVLPWIAGQALLAVALLQWFILLHEAGHLSLFRTRGFNLAVGHLAGCLALIPFASWRRVHGLHHVWTGWQDKDPTTAALTPRKRGRLQLAAVDVAWRLGLPLFSIVYRLSNYWNIPRLFRLFPSPTQRRAIALNALALLGSYVGAAWLLGWEALLQFSGLAIAASLALQDPLILSQHTHIPQPVSGGRRVEPLCGEAQQRYTRSLRFPRWFAHWVLLNFNAHELHHRFVSVPGYRLCLLSQEQPNEVHWWTWLRAAKRLRGSVFLFGNRGQSGFDL
jgi:acyl-lipid omega-6 desaturase (Delta-12 desaturase)